MDPNQPPVENYANPKTCLFHVLFKGAALAFYILSALFFNSFVIIFVVTVLLAALDFWVVKNVSGRILVGLRWWNEINDLGESVWKFESLDQESLARMNKKDSWLFWWTLYLAAAAWLVLGIFSLIRFQADYLLVVGVCLSLNAANIIGFTKCKKDAKKQLQQFASQTIASRFQSTMTVVMKTMLKRYYGGGDGCNIVATEIQSMSSSVPVSVRGITISSLVFFPVSPPPFSVVSNTVLCRRSHCSDVL